MNKLAKTVASLSLGTSLLLSTVSGASAATYTVKSGDTLSGIAKQYGTTYTAIMNLNGLKSTFLSIGQKLEVNGTSSTTRSYMDSPQNCSEISFFHYFAFQYFAFQYFYISIFNLFLNTDTLNGRLTDSKVQINLSPAKILFCSLYREKITYSGPCGNSS